MKFKNVSLIFLIYNLSIYFCSSTNLKETFFKSNSKEKFVKGLTKVEDFIKNLEDKEKKLENSLLNENVDDYNFMDLLINEDKRLSTKRKNLDIDMDLNLLKTKEDKLEDIIDELNAVKRKVLIYIK